MSQRKVPGHQAALWATAAVPNLVIVCALAHSGGTGASRACQSAWLSLDAGRAMSCAQPPAAALPGVRLPRHQAPGAPGSGCGRR